MSVPCFDLKPNSSEIIKLFNLSIKIISKTLESLLASAVGL